MPLDQGEDLREMSFLDHLEELRWHIIRSIAAIAILSVAAFVAKELVFHTIILGPSRPSFWTYQKLCELADQLSSPLLCIDDLPFIIQSRKMTGQFTMHITSSFVAGIVVAFPYIFWEFWRFISPGLYTNERGVTQGAVFFVTLLFSMGIMFGYFIVSPLSVNFLANYQIDASIVNEFDIISYVSTICMLVLSCGLVFQLPVVVFFLTKAGFITPAIMRTYRKHALVVILILSAVLTPPDMMSQVLIALPLLLLYQIGILISAWVVRREIKKNLQQERADTDEG